MRVGAFVKAALIVCVLSVGLVLLLGEIGLRFLLPDSGVKLPPFLVEDAKLGWRTAPEINWSGDKVDYAGVSRPVEIRTDSKGFRAFGNVAAERCKVLVLGDSFTFAEDVSQEATYYSLLASRLPVEVFAYGVNGYGTLQQSLFLNEWLQNLKPDLVLLQLCHNDFINNSFELTQQSALNQCHVAQPFMQEDGKILMRNPGHGPLSNATAVLPSLLLQKLAYRWDNRKGIPAYENGVEQELRILGTKHPDFSRATNISGQILRSIREACGDLPIIAFDTITDPPYHETFKRICAENGIQFVPEVSEKIAAAESNGTNVFAADGGHWNPLGHELCAEVLMLEISRLCHVEMANVTPSSSTAPQ